MEASGGAARAVPPPPPPPRQPLALGVAPLAPGLMVDIGIEKIQQMPPDVAVPIRARRGVVALDGEREIEFSPGDELTVRLEWDGPLTLDIPGVMAYAAENGLFTRMDETSRHANRLGD